LFRRPLAFRWRAKTTLENEGMSTHIMTTSDTSAAGNRERFVLHTGATFACSSST